MRQYIGIYFVWDGWICRVAFKIDGILIAVCDDLPGSVYQVAAEFIERCLGMPFGVR